jgi:L-serine dehydratase
MDYQTIQELVDTAIQAGTSIGAVVLADQAEQMELSEQEVFDRMAQNLSVMEDAVHHGMDQHLKSTSGLTGGDAWRMQQYSQMGSICGDFLAGAMARTLSVSEYNAAMGKIVAAPTAGSCGIMPGCLVSLLEEQRADRETIIRSMFTAAGFGMVIASQASVSGAQGGCQAECGSAAGMTAAALTEIMGGTPQQAADACAIALKNQLGLVCDPVAGLVEIPCIKRNIAGMMIACSSADMALAGIHSMIPADEVIMAMKEVGDSMSCALKETAQGGLAATPTARRLKEQVFGKEDA